MSPYRYRNQRLRKNIVSPDSLFCFQITKGLDVCVTQTLSEYVQFDVSGTVAEYIDRNTTIALQSPEAHRLSLLNKVFAMAQKQQHPMTESCCTMLLYNLGYNINFIESNFIILKSPAKNILLP